AAAESFESRIYAAGIGLEQRTVLRVGLRQHLARHVAEPEEAELAVLIERHRTEQLRELARGEPPRQVHLEEAILRVQEAGGEGEVAAAGRRDGRHAARIARDGHRRA